MAEATQTSQTEVVKVLDKIKKEMFERKQLRAQNETNKQLNQMNKNLDSLKPKAQDKRPSDVIKIPTVNDFVNGFARVSPVFTRDYSTWMKDTVDAGNEGNLELTKINDQLVRLSDSFNTPSDDTGNEYLNLISDQLKSANDDSLKRMDSQGDTLMMATVSIERISDTLSDIQKDTENANKNGRSMLVRLYSIENTIGRVGGLVVGGLQRILEGDNKWREKEEGRQGELSKEGKNNPVASSVIPKDDDQKDESSSGIGAAIAAMLGLNALKGFLLAPFKAIGKVVGTFFGMFGKLGKGIGELLGPFGKVLKFLKVGPLALIASIIDFGKGFINAKEILGKASVTIIDRVRAGITELVGGFGDLFDWVAKIFGFDTDAGKKVREFALAITEAPARWLNSVLDWVSNDLFAGIGRGTSLTEIPGKLADNLQTELMKLVDWISGGISSFVDDGVKLVGDIGDDIKRGFAQNVKRPFINMVNSIVDAMFDIIDKFVSIIPDSLGGETARKKMAEARTSMLMDQDGDQQNTAPAATVNTPTDMSKASTAVPPLQPLPDDNSQAPSTADGLKGAYGAMGGGSLTGAQPSQGRAANNIEQMKSLYAQQPATVVAPIQQNVNNAKQINNTTNFNSSSLEPTNQKDLGRLLWE